MTSDEIAQATDLEKDTTDRTLRRLRKEGKVTNRKERDKGGKLLWVRTRP